MASSPSELPSSCHRALIHPRALFNRSMHKCADHRAPYRRTTDPVGLPRLHRASSPAASPPTSLHGKRSRWSTWPAIWRGPRWIPESRPSTIQLHPRETRCICWTPLEWYSVSLRALVKIHLHVYCQPGTRINRCFYEVQTPARSTFMNLIVCLLISRTSRYG